MGALLLGSGVAKPFAGQSAYETLLRHSLTRRSAQLPGYGGQPSGGAVVVSAGSGYSGAQPIRSSGAAGSGFSGQTAVSSGASGSAGSGYSGQSAVSSGAAVSAGAGYGGATLFRSRSARL